MLEGEENKKITEELGSETELQTEELDAVAGGQTREHVLLARQVGVPLSKEEEPEHDGSEICSDPGFGIVQSG